MNIATVQTNRIYYMFLSLVSYLCSCFESALCEPKALPPSHYFACDFSLVLQEIPRNSRDFPRQVAHHLVRVQPGHYHIVPVAAVNLS